MVRSSRRQASLTASAKIKATEDDKVGKEDVSDGSDTGDDDDSPNKKQYAKKTGVRKNEYESDEEDEVSPKARKSRGKAKRIKEESDGEGLDEGEEEEGEPQEMPDGEYEEEEEYGKKRKKTSGRSKKSTPKARKSAKKNKKNADQDNADYDLGAGGLDLDDPIVKEREVVLTKIVKVYPLNQGYPIPDLMRACDRAQWDFEKAKLEVDNDERIQAEHKRFLESNPQQPEQNHEEVSENVEQPVDEGANNNAEAEEAMEEGDGTDVNADPDNYLPVAAEPDNMGNGLEAVAVDESGAVELATDVPDFQSLADTGTAVAGVDGTLQDTAPGSQDGGDIDMPPNIDPALADVGPPDAANLAYNQGE